MTVTRPQTTALDAPSKRGLRAILVASVISTVGDGAFVAAAPLAAATITRDPAAVALVLAAETLPWLVIAPFAGVLVDRWPRRPTMIAADALRGIAVAMLAALIAMNVATVLAIAACAFAIVAGVVFHSAASEAIIADLTRRDSHQLHLINGRLQSVSTAGRQLAGPPAGSWSYSIAPWLPFAANAVSFFVSAALIGLVPQAGRAAEARTGMWASLKQGASYLAAHRKLRLLAVLTGAANLSFNAGMATLVLYVTDAGGLSMTIAQYGLLLAAMAVGGLIGGLAAARILVRLGDNLVFVGGMFAEALAWILLLTAGSAWVAGAAISMMGFVVALKSVVIMGARQRLVPTEMLGRVISAYRVIGNGTAPAGALLGGLAGTAWGLRAPMLLAAGVVAVGGVFALRAFEPRESEHDNIR